MDNVVTGGARTNNRELIGWMIFIIYYLLLKGLPVFGLAFFAEPAVDMGRSGGILPFVASTVFLTLVALAIATPLGVGTAIYLTEYTRETRLSPASSASPRSASRASPRSSSASSAS